jgi:hypothetical protein
VKPAPSGGNTRIVTFPSGTWADSSADGAIFTITLASGAWMKIRATDVDYDRSAAYRNLIVVKADGVLHAPDKKSVTLTFSRGFLAAVWVSDIDYDVMRGGFAAYHARTGPASELDESVIVPRCARDWPDDFRMRQFCEDQQRSAVQSLRSRTMTGGDEGIIRAKCARDWPDDYRMRNYCEEQQLKALKSIRR